MTCLTATKITEEMRSTNVTSVPGDLGTRYSLSRIMGSVILIRQVISRGMGLQHVTERGVAGTTQMMCIKLMVSSLFIICEMLEQFDVVFT